MERIHKLIGNSGLYSRRKAEELIKEGRVTKNGQVATLGDTATWNDVIKVDDKKIKPNKKYYYVLNKPRGVISSTLDDKNRATVIDLIESAPRGLHPIGRLDYDTTGLIILTTDGEVTNILSNSESHVPKTYIVKTKDRLNRQQIDALTNGVEIDGVKTRKAKVKPLKREWSDCFIRLTISEGKYHQVKLMIEAVGSKVVKLHRERIGNMDVGILSSGIYKKLSLEELKSNIGYQYFETTRTEVESRRERTIKMKQKNKWAKAKKVTKRQSSRNKKFEQMSSRRKENERKGLESSISDANIKKLVEGTNKTIINDEKVSSYKDRSQRNNMSRSEYKKSKSGLSERRVETTDYKSSNETSYSAKSDTRKYNDYKTGRNSKFNDNKYGKSENKFASKSYGKSYDDYETGRNTKFGDKNNAKKDNRYSAKSDWRKNDDYETGRNTKFGDNKYAKSESRYGSKSDSRSTSNYKGGRNSKFEGDKYSKSESRFGSKTDSRKSSGDFKTSRNSKFEGEKKAFSKFSSKSNYKGRK